MAHGVPADGASKVVFQAHQGSKNETQRYGLIAYLGTRRSSGPDPSMVDAPHGFRYLPAGMPVTGAALVTAALLLGAAIAALRGCRTIQAARMRDGGRRARRLYEKTPVMLHAMDAEGRLLEVSDEWLMVLGYQRAEVTGRSLFDFMTRESGRHVRDVHLPRVLGGQRLDRVPCQFLARDGRTIDIQMSAVVEPPADGAAPRVLAVLASLTETPLAQDAVQRPRDRVVDAIGSLPLGFILWDAEGQVVVSNSRARDILGPVADHLTPGTHYEDLHRAMVRALLADQETGTGRSVPQPGNRDVWGHVTGGPFDMTWKDGRRLRIIEQRTSGGGLVTLIDDITGEHQMRQDLVKAKERAETASEAKSRLLAAASHDLRQPLQALQLYLGVLAVQMPEAGAALLHDVDRCITSLRGLLDDLLEITQLDAGLVEPQVQVAEIDAVVARVVSVCRPQVEAKGLALHAVSSRLWARTDPGLLERILFNLVQNAVRHTDRGRILVGCRRRRGHVRLEVWDTGAGIPEDRLAGIFEAFGQPGGPERNRQRGTGLGLAIVDRIARRLGHAVSARSRLGHGSVFWVEMPRALAPKAACAPSLEPGEAGGGRLIVVIEDEEQVRTALTMVLEYRNYAVIAAASPAEALLSLGPGTRPLDLILADYRLRDGMTGVTAVRQLREALGVCVPGIILTGDTAPDRIREVTESGLLLLHKPLEVERLYEAIQRAIGRRCDSKNDTGTLRT